MNNHITKLKIVVSVIGVLAGAAVLIVSSILRKVLPTLLGHLVEQIQDGTLPIRLDHDLIFANIVGVLLLLAGLGYGIYCLLTHKKDK